MKRDWGRDEKARLRFLRFSKSETPQSLTHAILLANQLFD